MRGGIVGVWVAAALLLAPAAQAGNGVGAAPAEPVLHGPPAAAAALLAAERAFAARSASAGAEAAFRDYLDPADSRAFTGGDALRGLDAIARSHADGGRLLWAPAEVFASKGGDMGAVWGVWTYTLPAPAKGQVTGRYVTVWRKDAAGAWKALIDIGAPDQAAPGG
jgi:ketosteroid isomerase-like protein